MYIKIDENNRIIAYSDIKQKGFIEVKKEIKLNDLFNYLYVNNEFIYSPLLPSLKKIKVEKIEELKAIRDKKISEDLEVEGALFQVRTEDLQKFFLKKIEFDLGTATTDNWRLADNTYKEIDFEFIKKILEAYGTRQREVFVKFGILEHQINNCSTVEEIEAIKWE